MSRWAWTTSRRAGADGSGGLDVILQRWYARLGERYVGRALLAIYLALGGVGLVGAVFGSRYQGYGLRGLLVGLVVVEAILALFIVRAHRRLRSEIATLEAWARGERTAAGPQTLLDFPHLLFDRLAKPIGPCTPPMAAVVLSVEGGGFSVDNAIVGLVGGALVWLYGAQVTFFGAELLVRPMRRQLVVRRATFAAHASHSMTTKLVVGLVATAVTLAFFVSSTLQPAGSGAEGTIRAVGVTVVSTVLMGLSLLIPVVRNSVAPIADLIRGTKAVARGDLDAEVPVTTTDELGELAVSFNEMLHGLRDRQSLRAENQAQARELAASRARIVAAGADERRRVERDLHDGAQQRLVLLRLKLGLARQLADRDPGAVGPALDDARHELDAALAELRDLAHGIYPAALTNDGLANVLAEAARQAPLPTTVAARDIGRHAAQIEAGVYFCCLEALQNAGKHAGADARVLLELQQLDGHLRFTVCDDGVGFDVAAAQGSAGLQNMVDRIGALGGTLAIESDIGQGTRVMGIVPVVTPGFEHPGGPTPALRRGPPAPAPPERERAGRAR